MRSRGFLIVLSGPSGAGKNTLLSAVLPRVPNLKYSVSATTRPPRPYEKDGVNYHFLDEREFQAMIDRGEFLEWAEFAGYRYGTPRAFVDAAISRGETVISDIDIQGAKQIKASLPEAVFVFLLPPSLAELRARLAVRGTDSAEAIDRRIQIATEELRSIADYDYWVMNDDLEEACESLIHIIEAERRRVARIDFGDDVIAALKECESS